MSNETELGHASSSHAGVAPVAPAGDNIHRGIFVPIASKNEDTEIYTLAGIKHLVINTAKGTGSTVHFTVTFDVDGAIFENDGVSADDVKKTCFPGGGKTDHVFLGFSGSGLSTTI